MKYNIHQFMFDKRKKNIINQDIKKNVQPQDFILFIMDIKNKKKKKI